MRRVGGLFSIITRFKNLELAARKAAKGKRSRAEVGRFFLELERELFSIQDELVTGSYKPGSYRSIEIREPKPRLIFAAPFRDRVVHHALCNLIEPLFDSRFVFHSYACRKEKGTHRAFEQFRRWSQRYPYVLMGDVRRFFPSIDHEVALALCARKIKDRQVLTLLATIVSSSPLEAGTPAGESYQPGDELFDVLDRRRGLPIGNLTSQLLGNIMLDPLDHYVTEELGFGAYLRYCDDFAIFAPDKTALRAARRAVVDKLHSLRLRAHPGKTRVRRTNAVRSNSATSPSRSMLGWRTLAMLTPTA